MIREGGYQLIHCHGARGNMMGALLRRSTGLPVVTTVHSDYRLDYLGRPLSRLTYGTINTIALRRLDYRIGVSDAMTDLLIKRGFDPDRLFTIYNGIDFTPRTPALSREEYFRSVGLEADGDSVVVGIAARLNPVKDIATLVRGFAKAHQECPSLRLLIAGDGEQMSMLKGLAAELGVERQVLLRRMGQRHRQFLPRHRHQHPYLPVRDLPLLSHRRGPGCPAHHRQPGGRRTLPH